LTAGTLFTLDGPLCAVETGTARQTTVCPECGRGQRTQISDLRVSLVCQPRHVWLSDGNAVLLDQTAIEAVSRIAAIEGLRFRRVRATWREDLPWSDRPAPNLMQLIASSPVSASRQCVEADGCTCGTVRSISFTPLIVLDPGSSSNIWHLAENSEVLVFDSAIRDALVGSDSDLEFLRVWRDGEHITPAPPLGGVNWGDL